MKIKAKLKNKKPPAPPPNPSTRGNTDPTFRGRDYLSRERMLLNHLTEDILRYGTPDQLDQAARLVRSTGELLDGMKLDYPKGVPRAPRRPKH